MSKAVSNFGIIGVEQVGYLVQGVLHAQHYVHAKPNHDITCGRAPRTSRDEVLDLYRLSVY